MQCRFLIATAMAVACATPLSAQTWTGATSNDWLNPANWSTPNNVPTGANPVVINTISPNQTVLGVSSGASGVTGNLFMGSANNSQGSLTIQNGSTLTSTGATIRVGNSLGSVGAVTVTGAGSHWTTSGQLAVGFAGAGTLNIENGGVVTALAGVQLGSTANGLGTLNISGGGILETTGMAIGAGSRQYNFDNGTVRALGTSPTVFFGGTQAQLNIAAGGLTVDSNGFTIGTLGFSGVGGLTKVGAGLFNLRAASSYAGETLINGGTLGLVQGANILASSRVVANATFDISGLASAGTSIQSLGGGSTGIVTLGTKNLTITNANDTFAGGIAGSGAVTISGGTQTFSGTNSYSGGTTIGSATLSISSDAALGDVAGALTIDSATLQVTGTTDMARAVTVTGSGGIFEIVGANNTLTVLQNITGAGAFDKTGAGTLRLMGNNNNYDGPTDVLEGTLRVDGAIHSAVSDVIVYAGATLGGVGTINNHVANDGTVEPGVGLTEPGAKLTINGDYAGAPGSRLALKTQLGGDSSPTDQLIIGNGGHVSRVTGVVITNVGGVGAQTTGSGIPVVVAQGGATTMPDSFTLAAPVAAGPFQYLLFRGATSGSDGNSWFLRSHCDGPDCPHPAPAPRTFYRPETAIYGSLPGVARALAISTVDTFHERYGDQDAVLGGGGRAWGRVFGEHNEQSAAGVIDSRFDGWIGGVQLGVDAFRWRGNDGSQDAGGFFFTLAKADGDVNGNVVGLIDAYAGSSDLSAPSFGAYYTHIGPGNWYVDSVAMLTMYEADGRSTNSVNTNVGGSGAFLSLEGGYPLAFGYGLALEPQAQLIYQHLDFGGLTDAFSTVGFDTADVLTGRVGLRLAADLGRTWRPYVKANLWQDWASGDDRVVYANTHVLASNNGSTALEVGGGVVGQLSDTLAVWAVADYTTDVAGNDVEAVRGNVGVKVGW
jgi:T5SS/PEP-CTERM-associated repeat protein/autotransporter-associated beta strand protein